MGKSKKDTSAIVSALGILMSIITALVSAVRKQGGTDADIYRLATPEGESLIEKIAALIVGGGKKVEAVKTQLLQLIATFQATAVEKFVVADHYKVDTSAKAKVRIYYVSEEFKKLFGEKVEENVGAANLNIHKLLKGSVNAPIMAELGDNKETKLAQFWEALEKQGNGQEGALLVNGWVIILYVIGIGGNFWTVYAFWSSGYGWCFDACSVGGPITWGGDFQVVSCDSLPL